MNIIGEHNIMATIEKYLEKGFHKQTDFYDKYGTGLPPIPFFSLSKQNQKIKENILDGISGVIDESDFINGKPISEFENKFGKWLESLSLAYPLPIHVIGTSSGTMSLIVSLKCLDIGQGDEVIIPNNGYVADAAAVISGGATPVFCDIDPLTCQLDINSVSCKLSEKTKAIIAIHMHGSVCDVLKLKTFGLPVIEDCAQAHGAVYDNHSVACWTDDQKGCFSFYPSKTLGAMGDAGAIVTTSEEYANKIRTMVNQGQSERNSFVEFPFSARMNTFQSIVLNEKLKYIDEYIKLRREIMTIYDENLPHKTFRQPKTFNRVGCSPYVYVIAPVESNKYKDRLKNNKIGFSEHYSYTLHDLKPFKKYYKPLHYLPSDLSVSIRMRERVLSLPLYPEMLKEDVYRVCEVLNRSV